MKVALIGYGKMGKEIEKILLERGHAICAKLNSNDPIELILDADVAIEFTKPEVAVRNIKFCAENNIPVVVGTTGWLNELDDVSLIINSHNSTLLHASNFSLGVNIFFEINEQLARLMDKVDGYCTSVVEIHHTEKLDAPSGTGISIAEGVIANSDQFDHWENKKVSEVSTEKALSIESKRLPNVPGTHEVIYSSTIDDIELKHTAHNRVGFAKGAVVAAEFLLDKKGVFTMKDVLNLT